MSVEWSPEQIDFTLEILMKKYKDQPKSIYVKFEQGRQDSVEIRMGTEVTVQLFDNNNIYIRLNTSSGSWENSVFPWKYRSIKKKVSFFRNIANNKEKETRRIHKEEQDALNRKETETALLKTFGDEINSEFEKTFLSKD